jgi:branched-chain amino acid transport system substrate-binding protein
MNKNRPKSFAVLLLVGWLITSCANMGGSPAEYKCLDAIGCVDIPAGEPIHIAYALALSGPDDTLGMDALHGIEIAMEGKNQIMGHEILLTGEDERCRPEGGYTASSKIAADDTIIAVIGPSCSEAARTGIPILSQAGLTIISPSDREFDLTQAGDENLYPGYARTAPNYTQPAKSAAEYAYHELGLRKAATIHDGSPLSDKLQEVFVDSFAELGGVITSKERIEPDLAEFTDLLSRIVIGAPELVYFPISLQAGSHFVRQVNEMDGLEITVLMGNENLFTPEVVEETGGVLENLYLSALDYSSLREPYQSEFLPKYIDRVGMEPINKFHAHAYDAFMLIANAIEKAAVVDENGVLHIPRQALRQALYSTQAFPGLTGILSCSERGDCAKTNTAIYQFRDAEFPPDKIWP